MMLNRRKLNGAARFAPPAALGAVCALLLFDLLAFWALQRRPLASVDGMETAIWAVLWGTAVTAGLRWLVMRESRLRKQVAASLLVMIAFSALHPWHNGYAVPAEMAVRADGQRSVPADAVVVFEHGPLSAASESRW
ncbi:MAG: hypothetical protein KF696_13790 [Planctomycetes bacterium]|nr:hypothetical protein [Planctomycetota bacterium]MCW8137054.1 hypothetical protein [Planctomycetota bacterium]